MIIKKSVGHSINVRRKPNASEPSVDLINYQTPKKYLEIPSSLGSLPDITNQAFKLKGNSEVETIQNVSNWMDQNLKYDDTKAYTWRNYDDVIRERAYGGCADQGIVCGVLLKAAGIPVIWIKTMDISWIWDFKKNRPFQSWSGHVFLELYVEFKWMLLNPGSKMLYKDYYPKARILPENRFAYHKGNDPKEMIMSLQWEQWKDQTKKYFQRLDESLLPVDPKGGTSLRPQVFIVGGKPYYEIMEKNATEDGFTVAKSFNCDYDNYLPLAMGQLILIEVHNGIPIVPTDVLEKYFPNSSQGLRNEDGTVEIGETRIRFIEFEKQDSRINADDGKK